MKTILISFVTILLFAGCGDQSIMPQSYYPPTISVTGIGTVNGIADMAVVYFSIDITDKDANVALNSATEKTDAIIAVIDALEINEDDVETIGYDLSLEEEYNYETYDYTGENIFHLTHSFSITIRDINTVSEVLTSLLEAGATSINGINFTISNREELISEAREKAILNAQETAQKLAEGLNISIGVPISVNEWIDDYSAYNSYPAYSDDYYNDYSYNSSSNSSVTLNVSVSFEIEQ